MRDQREYVVRSLELHLFFARIMKEHSLFLEAASTPPAARLAKMAEFYKQQFSHLLMQVVKLSDGIVGESVLNSGEVVTEFTAKAERQTQDFTGIPINSNITRLEANLRSGKEIRIHPMLVRQLRQINRKAIELLNGLIQLKENILNKVLTCKTFTTNYPLLIKHIIREAKLYRTFLINFESNQDFSPQDMRQTEQFWNRIMMEHALFIRGLLDPSEESLIAASDNFAREYVRLLNQAQKMNDAAIAADATDSLQETIRFRDFKQAGTVGIQDCKIQSIILPLLADHVLREANHYIRLLKSE